MTVLFIALHFSFKSHLYCFQRTFFGAYSAAFAVSKICFWPTLFSQSDGAFGAVEPAGEAFSAYLFVYYRTVGAPCTGCCCTFLGRCGDSSPRQDCRPALEFFSQLYQSPVEASSLAWLLQRFFLPFDRATALLWLFE